MRNKAELMDSESVIRAITRMSHQIVEKNHGTNDVCLVGIKRRGIPIAEAISSNIEKIEGVKIPCGELDITFYRDDLTKIDESPSINDTKISFDVNDKIIVLVDDVFYTGRTARAAIEAIFSLGRPRMIQLAVLIDRGHRELPIRADYVGKNVPTSKTEFIQVKLPPYDEETSVLLCEI